MRKYYSSYVIVWLKERREIIQYQYIHTYTHGSSSVFTDSVFEKSPTSEGIFVTQNSSSQNFYS